MTRPAPIYPNALKTGDKIGVIAPSGAFNIDTLKSTIDYLGAQGFEIITHPQTLAKNGQMAGTAAQKAAALHEYFSDPDIKAIFCTVGGNGAIHMLDLIDYGLIQQNSKIFMGFSDITVLLNAIAAKTGLVTFHGPTLSRMEKLEPKWLEQMIGVLTGQKNKIEVPNTDVVMEGVLYGGNLSMMQALIGTPFAPNMSESILLLEDINDHVSRYDRMIAHIKNAGWFKNLNGVIIGEFLKTLDNKERPFGFDIKEIFDIHAPDISKIFDIPAGHGELLCTLPIGAPISLKNGTLSFKALA